MYKLMIAEDEPLERLALRKIVIKNFFNITLLEDAKNGMEAVENAKIFQPDIILMDIRMPELTGLEAQERIIKVFPHIKTIVLTAYGEFDYAQKAIKHGVIDYLLKPVRPDDLKRSIASAIESLGKNTAAQLPPRHNPDPAHKDTLLNTVLACIEQHCCTELTLNTVAEIVHLNPQYLSRYFKNKMGITFTEYVAKLRIEKAKKLFIDTNYPIYRIATELGFSDQAYFNRVFKKYENQSPQKYRKFIKQNV